LPTIFRSKHSPLRLKYSPTIFSSKTGEPDNLTYAEIPPLLVHAILAIEDQRFFRTSRFDVLGIARALVRNAGEDRVGQGGSTITQQLVKNTYLSSSELSLASTPRRCLRLRWSSDYPSRTSWRSIATRSIWASVAPSACGAYGKRRAFILEKS